MATKKSAGHTPKSAKATDDDSPLIRPLATPSLPKHWKPSTNQSHLRNRPRERERIVAMSVYEQVRDGKHRYKEVFGELAPDVDRVLKQLDAALFLERERVSAAAWLAYLEEESQRAWADAAETTRRLAIVYALVEKLRGKPKGFGAVGFFREARSTAAKKAGATKKAKRGAR